MAEKLAFQIRDGKIEDLSSCLALDHTYETEYVWQVRMHDDDDLWQISLRNERLPRILNVDYAPSVERMTRAADDGACFLVAASQETQTYVGYLVMFVDNSLQMARIRDVVVSRPFRRNGVGLRLLKIARLWAREHGLRRITAETQTKNHPGISMYQRAGMVFCGFDDQYYDNQDIALFFGNTLR